MKICRTNNQKSEKEKNCTNNTTRVIIANVTNLRCQDTFRVQTDK